MADYSNNEKVDMLKCYFSSNNNSRQALRLYRQQYPNRFHPHYTYFGKLESKLRRTGSLSMEKGEPRDNNENLEVNILTYFNVFPRNSIREAALELNTSHYKVHKILKKHKYKPYKLHKIHNLHPGDDVRRLQLCNYLIHENFMHPNFLNKILWTDECNFSNNGILNRQNTHYWQSKDTNPRETFRSNFQIRFSINVWCGIINNIILGPHFYHGNLTSQRYLNFLQNELNNYLDDIPLETRRGIIFQQDGAPPHNAMVVTNYLNQEFPNSWIGSRGPIMWPARSPDLSPLDFFLWGAIKNKIYDTHVATLDELINRIRQAVVELNNININQSLLQRLRLCVRENGSNFEQFL